MRCHCASSICSNGTAAKALRTRRRALAAEASRAARVRTTPEESKGPWKPSPSPFENVTRLSSFVRRNSDANPDPNCNASWYSVPGSTSGHRPGDQAHLTGWICARERAFAKLSDEQVAAIEAAVSGHLMTER